MCDVMETNERDDLRKGKLISSVQCIREGKQENKERKTDLIFTEFHCVWAGEG